MALVELQGVSKTYPMGDLTVQALREVSVAVEPGEFTVFSGPSGSGKSTLLNLIGCLDRPSSGVVRLEGRDLSTLSDASLAEERAKRIGFIFQSFNLIPVLTVAENVEMALRLARQLDNADAKVLKALESVGIAHLKDRRPAQLSGGQQQRVAIARALVKEPAIVIADEPTANLDSQNGASILALMKEMNRAAGVTFLFSTHDAMVMGQAQRIVRLLDGSIVSDTRASDTSGSPSPSAP